jgi:hypothetical protein
VTDKSIQIAFVNAGDLHAIDELSFSVGRRVIPWVLAEVRITQALEKYYGVERKPRFITLSLYLDEIAERNKRLAANLAKRKEPIAPPPPVSFEAPADHAYDSQRSWHEVAEELDKRTVAAPELRARRTTRRRCDDGGGGGFERKTPEASEAFKPPEPPKPRSRRGEVPKTEPATLRPLYPCPRWPIVLGRRIDRGSRRGALEFSVGEPSGCS